MVNDEFAKQYGDSSTNCTYVGDWGEVTRSIYVHQYQWKIEI